MSATPWGRRGTWTLGVSGCAAIVGYFVLWFVAGSLGRDRALPAVAAAWVPNAMCAASPATSDAYASGVQAWRAKHEADYRREWVSIAGLHFLEPGTFSVGGAATNDIVLAAAVPPVIGRLIVVDGWIRYEPEPGVPAMQKGRPVTGPIVLKEPGGPPADELTINDVRLVIHVSGERLSLRVRPFTTRAKRFYIVFRDASSGVETYETARFLYADLLDDGTTVLDFNEAYNPPGAFNPYTTCPIPLKENTLPVRILAGEKAYPVHVALPTPAS